MSADRMVVPSLRGNAVLWWLVPVALLAALVGWEIDWGRRVHYLPDPPATIEPKPVTPALLPEYQIDGGIAAHPETVSRTLFNPTRRAAPVLATESGQKQFKSGQFVLTGTTVAGDRAIAFLKEVAGGKSRTVRQGDQINGMKVAQVTPDRVTLTLGDESEELVLKVAPGPKMTLAPPPPVPGAPQAPGAAPVATAVPGAAATPGAAPATAAPVAPEQRRQEGENALRERRRAAREAAAAAAANPQSAPTATPDGGGVPASTNPAWNDAFRRMQQRG